MTRPPPRPTLFPSPTLFHSDADELMRRPEVRAHLEEFQRRHYETWPEIPLPALNNKTPLEAIQDPDGREMVEALITQFERSEEHTSELQSQSNLVCRLLLEK